MNRERAKELLPIIQAYAEGKSIQFQRIGMTGWYELQNHGETFEAEGKYRIKPEPREFWTVIYSDGKAMSAYKDSKKDAERFIDEMWQDNPGWSPDAYVAKVREVIE